MHIVTFYAFKGGTGRSLALANCAAELARRGKRVLMVDFDLEAPGLDTYPFKRPVRETLGVVDLIHDYLRDREVPDISRYLYQTSFEGQTSGQLWLMPAGRQDASYDEKFKAIDWADFYENQDGFLFFEDLKIQWNESLKADYILIDSRTGHTDIGGICTRQLPDAVVVMFFPNEQNLRGLQPVVKSIRREATGPLKKNIFLHFVLANMPDIDDDNPIAQKVMRQFSQNLGYEDLAATIHHFNSWAMLEQRLFVADGARSKIANEYRRLVAAIVGGNVGDRDGVIAFLDDVYTKLRLDRTSVSMSSLEDRIRRIKSAHPSDFEILRRLARLRRIQRRTEEALGLLDQIKNAGVIDAEILIARAEMLAQSGRPAAAVEELNVVLTLPNVPVFDLTVAVRLKLDLDPDCLGQLLEAPSISSLGGSDISLIAQELQRSTKTIGFADVLLFRWLATNPISPDRFFVYLERVLCLIGSGQFKLAKSLIEEESRGNVCKALHNAFNYGMADWADTAKRPEKYMRCVLEIAETADFMDNPNYFQCLSLAHAICSNREEALRYFQKAAEGISGAQDATFSAWSYLMLPAGKFLDDLFEMTGLIEGLPVIPGFMRRSEIKKS